ncbi:pectinesterase inhibitor 7-like [Diospyros lotus]|uniref:pectinesterase inhibitor 7-like n=1 Tax=Diospyros lotus TaxID=55363 RepID=UPI002250F4FE|nr:pectinesterase inhibitor 7-like [Diospyros lotus]
MNSQVDYLLKEVQSSSFLPPLLPHRHRQLFAKLSLSLSLSLSLVYIPIPLHFSATMKLQLLPPLFLTLLSSSAFLFHLHPIPASAASSVDGATTPSNGTDFIRTSCGATLYPDLCYTSLSGYANAVQEDPASLARVAIHVSLSKARRMTVYLSNISRQADYGADPRSASAVHDCFSVFGDAVDQIRGSLKQMRQLGPNYGGGSLRFQLSNVQTWMSAALTNEDTCEDGFEDVPDAGVKMDVCDRVVKVKEVTSNALALVNSYVSKVSP